MNRETLVMELFSKLPGRIRDKLTKSDVARIVDLLLDTARKAVASGERVTLSGFGTFQKQRRNPRLGRNPRTGEAVRVAATTTVRFRPGGAFKEAVLGRRKRKSPRKKSMTRKPARKR